MAADVLEAMISHARADAPNECCGLLVGTPTRLDESVPARNVFASPTRYRVDPAQHFALLRRVRRTGRAVIGAYHSHLLTPARPSPRDVAEAHDPDLLYVIVSLRDAGRPDVRGYRIRGGEVSEVRLVASP